jgi:heme/copper-type cytochrome/quinol oxidase subunit 3
MATAINVPGALPRGRQPLIPSAVIATLVLILTEVMYFCALISAFNVIRAQLFGNWAPPGDVRLPVAATAFNTALLLASGVTVWLSARAYKYPEGRTKAQLLLLVTITLGACFVGFQGYEWVKLVQYGMTMRSGIFGATFFMIIGSHGIHVLAAVLVMAFLYMRMLQGRLSLGALQAMQVFWLFVVGVWPILYRLVYFA